MSTNELVTIIIPLYNNENSVEDCLNSVIMQTYKNLEIIVINDGSTDNSMEICKKTASRYNNILIYNQENSGVSAARNKGIELSKGDYIIFLDSDDTLEKETVEQMMFKMIDLKVELVICDFSKIDKSTNEKQLHTSISEEKIYDKSTIPKFLIDSYYSGIINNIGTKLYKKSVLIQEHIVFDDKHSICEDGLFCVQVLKKIKYLYYLKKPYYNYCYNEQNISLMSSYKKNYIEAKLNFINNIFELFDNSFESVNFINNINIDLLLVATQNELKYKTKNADSVIKSLFYNIKLDTKYKFKAKTKKKQIIFFIVKYKVYFAYKLIANIALRS